jgi:integrase
MPRPQKIWYRKARKEWCVKIEGILHRLGPDKKTAETKFHELMLARPKKTTTPDTVVAILDQFLAWNDANRKPRTQETYIRFIQPFAESIGTMRVHQIKTHHVQQFIDSLNGGDSVKNMAWRTLNRAFRWAIQQELMERNPATNAEKPASRTREDYVTEAEYKIIMENTKDQAFLDLLTAAWECGARPQELFTVEAQNVELDKSRWHFPKGKRGLRRFVYLTEAAEEITKRLMEQYPSGVLFRNTRGQPWDRHAVKCRFERLKEKVGRQVSLYLFRHSQITRQLASGMDSHFVAALAGHRDSKMIDRVYGHAKDDWQLMRDKLRGSGSGE